MSKLTKRIPKAKPAPIKPASTPEPAAEPETFTMPDPEAEVAEKVPKIQAGKGEPISHTCGNCRNVSTVWVESAEAYDEKARIALFKSRGSSYKPPLCRWCVGRQPKSKRVA